MTKSDTSPINPLHLWAKIIFCRCQNWNPTQALNFKIEFKAFRAFYSVISSTTSFVSLALLTLLIFNAQAQNTPNTDENTSNSVGTKAVLAVKLENHPTWHDLDANQKIALAPLQKLWSKMSDYQKQKWLVISKNYMTLSSDEQSRIQSRMRDWVSLSNEERAVARLNFAEVNKLSEDQKRVKWEAYQALEPDVKQKLLDQSPPLPKGVAIAIKPTNKSLLTNTPEVGLSESQAPAKNPRIDTSKISSKTLLKLIPKGGQATMSEQAVAK